MTAHLEMKADHGDSGQIVACIQIFQEEGWQDINNRIERARCFFRMRMKLKKGLINKAILYVRIQIALQRLQWRFANSKQKKWRETEERDVLFYPTWLGSASPRSSCDNGSEDAGK